MQTSRNVLSDNTGKLTFLKIVGSWAVRKIRFVRRAICRLIIFFGGGSLVGTTPFHFFKKRTFMFLQLKRFQSTMSTLKFCANLSFMYQDNVPFLERYAHAKRSGFRAVECAFPYDFPAEDVRKSKEEASVCHVLINTYPGPGKPTLGFAAVPGKEKEFQDCISRAVTYAKALDCGLVHIMAGQVETPTSEHDELYKKNLRYAAGIFEKENITGLIEIISPASVPNYYLNSFQKAVDIVKEINHPRLKIELDIFHLQFLSGNLTHNIEWLLPYVGHIQIAQVPDRHEPSSEGEIDFLYLFKVLSKLKYSGWIGLEYKPATSTEDSIKWLKDKRFEGLIEPLCTNDE